MYVYMMIIGVHNNKYDVLFVLTVIIFYVRFRRVSYTCVIVFSNQNKKSYLVPTDVFCKYEHFGIHVNVNIFFIKKKKNPLSG